MASGHVERRGKKGWTTLVIDYGEYMDKSQDPPKLKRRREKETLPLAPGQKYMKKEDAEAILWERLEQINRGAYVPRSRKMTVHEALRGWYKMCEERVIPRPYAPKTLENYEMRVDLTLRDLNGKAPAEKAAPLIQDLFNRWLREGKTPRSVEQTHQVLHIAFGYWVKQGALLQNPLDFVEPPAPPKKKRKVLDPDGLNKFLDVAMKRKLGKMFFFISRTGARRGEAAGLKWPNVDLASGWADVTEMRQYVRGKTITKPPKSDAGVRSLPLDDETVAMLREMKKNAKSEYVFAKEDGTPYSPSHITSTFKTIAKAAGFGEMKLHGLRHTFATLGLASKVDLVTMQALLGHEDLGTTREYTQVLDDLKREAVNSISRTMQSANNKPNSQPEKKANTSGTNSAPTRAVSGSSEERR